MVLNVLPFVPRAGHAQGGVFYVGNQAEKDHVAGDGSALIEVELPIRVAGEPRILNYYPQKLMDLSGLFYDFKTKHLFVLSDFNNLLTEMDLDGKVLNAYALPGESQEGVTRDGRGRLFIAQDYGGVLRLGVQEK